MRFFMIIVCLMICVSAWSKKEEPIKLKNMSLGIYTSKWDFDGFESSDAGREVQLERFVENISCHGFVFNRKINRRLRIEFDRGLAKFERTSAVPYNPLPQGLNFTEDRLKMEIMTLSFNIQNIWQLGSSKSMFAGFGFSSVTPKGDYTINTPDYYNLSFSDRGLIPYFLAGFEYNALEYGTVRLDFVKYFGNTDMEFGSNDYSGSYFDNYSRYTESQEWNRDAISVDLGDFQARMMLTMFISD